MGRLLKSCLKKFHPVFNVEYLKRSYRATTLEVPLKMVHASREKNLIEEGDYEKNVRGTIRGKFSVIRENVGWRRYLLSHPSPLGQRQERDQG
jgi:hypothetical protein